MRLRSWMGRCPKEVAAIASILLVLAILVCAFDVGDPETTSDSCARAPAFVVGPPLFRPSPLPIGFLTPGFSPLPAASPSALDHPPRASFLS
jgi:hypothetical protein